MICELDTIALARDIEDSGLKRGDIGAVVHCYEDGDLLEVEFVTVDGTTIALLQLSSADVRPIGGREVLHVRELAQAAT